MTPEELKEMLAAFKKMEADFEKNPELATQFLIKAGIIDENGELIDLYASANPPVV